jgi:NADH-quinone oxidoreductase subunit F
MPATRDTKIITRYFGDDTQKQIAVAEKRGAYAAVAKTLGRPPAEIQEQLKVSNLRGRGGAGFYTGAKWGFVPKDAKTTYLVINADESEPGTCKDRELIYWDPHLLIEGIIDTAYAMSCHHAYIYIRGEMMREYLVLKQAVADAYARGYLGKNVAGTGYQLEVTVHRGAGAYICGEETGLLSSLEGKRGWPRLKPPFPAIVGLFGQPTIINNPETIMNVPAIVDKGGAWFAALGMGKSGGTRLLCVSGHVNKPGVYELPMGISFRELIFDVCGGVPGGKRVKGVIPGGVSMPPLDESELDVPCEFDALQTDKRIKECEVSPGVKFDMGGGRTLRTMAGSGGVVVMDQDTDMPRALARISRFFAHESCGQCTPCREGSGWLARVATRIAEEGGRPGDVDLLTSIAHGIAGNSICALGDAAAWAALGFVTKFRSEFEAKVEAAQRRGATTPAEPPAASAAGAASAGGGGH